jgi:hypothetical protein
MNIELDEVVVIDVSDDALEQAAGGAGGAFAFTLNEGCMTRQWC